ncbi:hypothetical protein ACFZDP_26445 [Streptomyces mirabilis]|uniref:hypothetical protein n=1 Tax=Streptomyces mirabilis TaxID=68239 RepID=UPI0036E436F7
MTAPSTSTASAAPGCLGALPWTATTVATAKARPCLHQRDNWSAMSSMMLLSVFGRGLGFPRVHRDGFADTVEGATAADVPDLGETQVADRVAAGVA